MLTAKKIPGKRVRTPTVLQMEAVECGAAALSIIMSYHGKWRPLEVLRAECGVSRDGSNARNILYGARRNGFEAKGRKASVETALQTEFPFIAFWNFNHFLVIEGYRNGFVYLNDPATGPRRVSLEEFDDAFTGVILVFKPDENFQKDAKPPGLFARLLPRTKSIRTPILLAVLISLTLVVPGLLVPGFAKIFVDDFLIQGQADWLHPLLIAMGITAVVAAALNWLSQSLLLKMETKLALADSTRFVWHVLRLPINFFEQRHPGDISNRIDANDRIAAIVAGQLGESLVSLVTVIFYAVVMFYFDPLLAFIAIGLSLTNILIFRLLARRRGDASIRMQQDYGQFQSASVTGIQAIETLKATGTDDDYFQRWSGFQAKHLNNMRRLGSYNIIASAFPPAIDGLIVASILGIGGFRVLEGAMTAGSLIAMQVLIQNFSNPVNRLVAVGGAFQELSADLARSDDVFKQEQDVRFGNENRGSSDTKQLTGSIELRDLSFGYSQLEPPLIENFSLSLRPGSRVALVGGSGSGKSTVAKLISGLFHPWSGEIRFDGVPLQEISVDTLTASIASVSQEVVLFGGSIRSNLSLWDDTLPDSVMIQALRDAQIYDVVSARGDGLDLSVDEDGSNFSGGQSQRLEIARALSSSPRILILDEATSALDPATEKLIDENLRRRGCTCIIVAHRLSTIRDADEIVVMDRGKVVERGSHDELVAAKGYYHGLIAEVEE